MDLFERFNSKFGKWYEGFFGSEGGELRPKDVLRKITAAMEDNRKEGFDSKIYVPNKYILELALDSPEERDYLLSFLDEEELTTVLTRFMGQHGYHSRGPLDFTIAEVPESERAGRTEKLKVKVRYEKGAFPEPSPSSEPITPTPSRAASTPINRFQVPVREDEDDLPTVANARAILDDDEATVPAVRFATLAVTNPEGRAEEFRLTAKNVSIGRSRSAGNDLVLQGDGMVSKSHARIEPEANGQFTLVDLGSTNGVLVNGVRIENNHVLADGDEILIGATTLVFQDPKSKPKGAAMASSAASPRIPRADNAQRARLIDEDGEGYVLASETLIGRAVTSDIVLDDPNVATKHARIVAPDRATYYLEDLGSDSGTRINGRPLTKFVRSLLADGDVIVFGSVIMHFASEGR